MVTECQTVILHCSRGFVKVTTIHQSALVIGAGIAGSQCARALAERGFDVTVLDAQPRPTGTDTRLQGALYVKLGVDYSPETRFAWTALRHALSHYPSLQSRHPETPFWHPSGLLQLAWNEREADRQRRFLARNRYPEALLKPVSAAEATELCGLPVECSGLWFPANGHILPERLCAAALDHPQITTRFDSDVIRIEQQNTGAWLVHTPEQSHPASRLVVATGAATETLLPELPLKSIRGQLSLMNVDATSDNFPQCVVCGAGYAIPPLNGTQIVGATFDIHDDSAEPRPESHEQNLANLAQWFPALARLYDTSQSYQARVGFRATTPDYLPVAGPVTLRQQRQSEQPSLFVLTGLGSKGLAYSPILAEHIACSASAEPSPLDEDLVKRLCVRRFQKKGAT